MAKCSQPAAPRRRELVRHTIDERRSSFVRDDSAFRAPETGGTSGSVAGFGRRFHIQRKELQELSWHRRRWRCARSVDGSSDAIVRLATSGFTKAEQVDKQYQFSMNPRGGVNLIDPQIQAVLAYVWSLSHK